MLNLIVGKKITNISFGFILGFIFGFLHIANEWNKDSFPFPSIQNFPPILTQKIIALDQQQGFPPNKIYKFQQFGRNIFNCFFLSSSYTLPLLGNVWFEESSSVSQEFDQSVGDSLSWYGRFLVKWLCHGYLISHTKIMEIPSSGKVGNQPSQAIGKLPIKILHQSKPLPSSFSSYKPSPHCGKKF